MLAADGGGGSPTKKTADLERGVGALEKFKKKVDALLADFDGSAAGGTTVAAQRVSRSSFSGSNAGFAEADGLYTQYNRVHESLVSLSRSLGDQIEYLSIGVYAAAVGYDDVDDDMRRRFYEIQARIDREAGRDRAEGGASSGPRNDDKKSDAGWAAE
ncbi:hypothetical protein [uncultured Streptomyces sp.]|uniref:hypothetical protein n=1 Tax=uncultured Streptomyces sp. TaxID=174707 RepID=UPI0026325524|nr:hypothetical protein [uncultured Streptomyces sp.]